MHLDEGQAQRAADGASIPVAAAEHLARCDACRTSVAAAREEMRWLHATLARLDTGPVADIDARRIVARAREQASTWGRRAATVLLTIGAAGAAWAAPGSPLPGLLERIRGAPDTPAASTPAVRVEPRAGIAVPVEDSLIIVFAAEQPSGRVSVLLYDGTSVAVHALTDEARFTTDADRLEVHNNGSTGDYEIRIPRDAPHVEIRVVDRRILLKSGRGVSAETGPDAQGWYRIAPWKP